MIPAASNQDKKASLKSILKFMTMTEIRIGQTMIEMNLPMIFKMICEYPHPAIDSKVPTLLEHFLRHGD